MTQHTPCTCFYDSLVSGLIVFCPLHAQAGALRDMLDKMLGTFADDWPEHEWLVVKQARALLAATKETK